jgi:fatty acid desaturase
METVMATWETQLWDELNSLPVQQQIVVSGQIMTHITHHLLTELAEFRRDAALRAVEELGQDPASVAESIGSRRSVIERLAADARAAKREKRAHGYEDR